MAYGYHIGYHIGQYRYTHSHYLRKFFCMTLDKCEELHNVAQELAEVEKRQMMFLAKTKALTVGGGKLRELVRDGIPEYV